MNHSLRAALEKLAECRAELAKRTASLKEANDRLAASLGIVTPDPRSRTPGTYERWPLPENRGANFGGAL